MVKLIAFDLDDTLAKPGKGITPNDLSKLKLLEQKGLVIVVCSGKTVDYLCGFMRQTGLNTPVLVGENGAVIQIGVGFPPKQFFIQSYSLASQRSITLLREKITKEIPTIWYQPNLVGLTPFPKNESELEKIQTIINTYLSDLNDVNIYRHVDSFDIIPIGISKKSGMKLLSNMLHITPAETVAVGNGENDYPMFDYTNFAIGINVSDSHKVNINFRTLSEALDFLLKYTEEHLYKI